jgi:hypothetical protein
MKLFPSFPRLCRGKPGNSAFFWAAAPPTEPFEAANVRLPAVSCNLRSFAPEPFHLIRSDGGSNWRDCAALKHFGRWSDIPNISMHPLPDNGAQITSLPSMQYAFRNDTLRFL